MITASESLIGPVAPPLVHLMTFNLRRPVPWSWRRDGRWSVRRAALSAVLISERPTVFAAQEVTGAVDDVVRAALGPSYIRVGTGRTSDGTGEMCPLYIDTARLEVRAQEQVALSSHPERRGSRGWGSLSPRVAVIATLRDLRTGAVFTAVGTHVDHVSERARVMAARQVGELVGRRHLPAVVMGDLNAAPTSSALLHLTGGRSLRDAWAAAEARVSPEAGTRPGYRAPRLHGRRIDHILVTPDIRVAAVGVNTSHVGGRRASDHLAVQATVVVPPPEESHL